jgi:chorismate mutase/prephenate dehydrogenase
LGPGTTAMTHADAGAKIAAMSSPDSTDLAPPAVSPARLAEIRAELDGLDRQLLETASRRARLVAEVAAFKRAEGRPIYDRERERRIVHRAEEVAAEVGLDRATARALMNVLVDASHRLQEAALREPSAAAEPRHVAIVGGRGQMGLVLGRWLSERGHRVTPIDQGDDDGAISDADIVMVAVPMAQVRAVVTGLTGRLRPDALLCDVNSLKRDVCEAMADAHAGEVLGLHPMFGPSVSSIRRQKVVVCPVRPGPIGAALQAELGRMGAELIEATPDAHDRMMAVIQVLVHFSTIARGDALRRVGIPIEDSLRFTSPIYRLELSFIGRLFTQNPDLYAEITMQNPHSEPVRAAFVEAVNTLDRTVTSGDRGAFRDAFRGAGAFFAGFGPDAMRLSDLLIETLVKEP